ncbi:hypothetical protein Syun_020789 [Stephania yunnanensis]|uniref:Uncharacterized protein n=1 Tax=Stephania yunnanensis TaxID=152371 RepID=A0AAP0NNJ8_9MAGN
MRDCKADLLVQLYMSFFSITKFILLVPDPKRARSPLKGIAQWVKVEELLEGLDELYKECIVLLFKRYLAFYLNKAISIGFWWKLTRLPVSNSSSGRWGKNAWKAFLAKLATPRFKVLWSITWKGKSAYGIALLRSLGIGMGSGRPDEKTLDPRDGMRNGKVTYPVPDTDLALIRHIRRRDLYQSAGNSGALTIARGSNASSNGLRYEVEQEIHDFSSRSGPVVLGNVFHQHVEQSGGPASLELLERNWSVPRFWQRMIRSILVPSLFLGLREVDTKEDASALVPNHSEKLELPLIYIEGIPIGNPKLNSCYCSTPNLVGKSVGNSILIVSASANLVFASLD